MADLANHREAVAFVRAALPVPQSRVIDLGWEGASLAELLVPSGAKITYLGDDIRDVHQCRVAFPRVRAVHGDSPLVLPQSGGDLVLYRPHQRAAKPQVFGWMDAAFHALDAGGRFFLFGRKDRGVESYARRLAQVFGDVVRGPRIGKGRVFWAVKNATCSGVPPVSTTLSFVSGDLPGGPYEFSTRAGVFSRDGVDPGSRFLLDQLDIARDANILDLGCGWGLLGIACARLAPQGQVHLVDVSFRAAACARENARANGVGNVRVEVGDGCEGRAAPLYDLVVSNPPFHAGNAIGHAFIDGAARRLKAGGCVMLVAMRPEPYLRHMRRRFSQVEVCAEREGFFVLRGARKLEPGHR